MSPSSNTFTNYFSPITVQNTAPLTPSYTGFSYQPTNYSPPENNPRPGTNSYKSNQATIQHQPAPYSNYLSNGGNQPISTRGTTNGFTNNGHSSPVSYQTNWTQNGNGADPLRQSVFGGIGQLTPLNTISTPRTIGSGPQFQQTRGTDNLRASQNFNIYNPEVQLYGRSNSVSQTTSDPMRSSFYNTPFQELDFSRIRPSTSVDTRIPTAQGQPNFRPSMSFGQNYQTIYSPEVTTIYSAPNTQAWNKPVTSGNLSKAFSGEQANQSPVSTKQQLEHNKPRAPQNIEAVAQAPTTNGVPAVQPAPVANKNNISNNYSPVTNGLSPESKRNNPLWFGFNGNNGSSTPSKPEVKNLNVATTPGSFVISEPSTPTTPDVRGNQSTHGKSLRSIKLFETPAPKNHAYPTVGHLAYNPAVPLAMSSSNKGYPPVKIDIHTDSCYNYLNKRMYFENHETHTPLEQFFFRESLGQFKVAQMLAPHLPTVKLPTPKQIPRRKKYLLVLDIDETLVHSELIVEQNVPKAEKAHIAYDRKLEFPNPNGTFDVYGIRFRPFLMEFLQRMNKHYDLALYTASAQDYGNAVASELDPTGTLFVARLFRENCIHVNGVNVKSMKNFEGTDAYLVDNLIYSFPFDLERGIPICPFVDDAMDVELKDLAEILENLPSYDSLHSLVNELLGLKDFYAFLGKKISAESDSPQLSPIMKQHEAATQSANDRTAGANTIYF